jgi:hypothetical protein
VNRLNNYIAFEIGREEKHFCISGYLLSVFFSVLVSLYVILFMNHTLNMNHILVAFVNFVPVFSARYVQRQKKELSIKHIIQHSRTRMWHPNEINA